jgi:hypothetical protein
MKVFQAKNISFLFKMTISPEARKVRGEFKKRTA